MRAGQNISSRQKTTGYLPTPSDRRWASVALAAFLALSAARATGEPADRSDTIFAAARDAVGDNRLAQTPLLGFRIIKTAFREAPAEGAVFVGFDVALGWSGGSEAVYGLRPLYRAEDGLVAGQDYGQFPGNQPQGRNRFGARNKATRTVRLLARPGYAVGGLVVRSAVRIQGLSLVFMRVNGLVLDPEKAYDSGWAGGKKGQEKSVGTEGAPAVGVFGNLDRQAVLGLGLICMQRPAVPARQPAPPPVVREPEKPAPAQPAKPAEPAAKAEEKKPPVEAPAVKPAPEAAPAGGGASLWLPIGIFVCLTVPCFLLLLAVTGRKKAPAEELFRRKKEPEKPAVAATPPRDPAGPDAPPPAVGRPGVVDPAAISAGLPLPPVSPPRREPESPRPTRLSSFDPPAAPVVPPLAPLEKVGGPAGAGPRMVNRCTRCRHAVEAANGVKPPWCPRCGGNIETVADDTPQLPSPALGFPVNWKKCEETGPAEPLGPTPGRPGRTRKCYTAKIQARCWKQHTCSACGCVYRYQMERAGMGCAGGDLLAREMAERNLAKAMRDGVESRPCPTCGLVQPDMVTRDTLRQQTYLVYGSLAALLFLVLPATGIMYVTTGATLAACVAVAAALAHLWILVQNPNADRAANVKEAQAAVARDRIRVVKPGATEDLFALPCGLTGRHWLALAALAASALLFLLPVFVCSMEDLPVNPAVAPYVIGPGDEVTVYFRNGRVQSVKGYWRGSPEAALLNAGQLGVENRLAASSSTSEWGYKIYSKYSALSQSSQLYAKVRLPRARALGGQTVQLSVSMTVTYPVVMEGGKTFRNDLTQVSEVFPIKLAAAEAVEAYRTAWVMGGILGLIALVGGGALLVWLGVRLKALALRSEVVLEGW